MIADRGFAVEEDLAEKNLKLHIPSFLRTKRAHLTAGEVTATRRIAEARVHVEKAIERLKEFEILCEVELASLHILEQVFQVSALSSWRFACLNRRLGCIILGGCQSAVWRWPACTKMSPFGCAKQCVEFALMQCLLSFRWLHSSQISRSPS